MRIALGSDHAGYQLKTTIATYLKSRGHDVQDHGTYSDAQVDYPPFCAAAARAVVRGEADRRAQPKPAIQSFETTGIRSHDAIPLR